MRRYEWAMRHSAWRCVWAILCVSCCPSLVWCRALLAQATPAAWTTSAAAPPNSHHYCHTDTGSLYLGAKQNPFTWPHDLKHLRIKKSSSEVSDWSHKQSPTLVALTRQRLLICTVHKVIVWMFDSDTAKIWDIGWPLTWDCLHMTAQSMQQQ